MAPEAIARLASVSFALFAVYGWLGLLFSTPLVGTIVSPIVATTPLFSLVLSLIFLRGTEKVTGLTILGTVAVVAGTIAIALGK